MCKKKIIELDSVKEIKVSFVEENAKIVFNEEV